MKNNKIQFLLIFIITVSSSNAFGIDYFWLTGMAIKDNSYLTGVEIGEMSQGNLEQLFNKDLIIINTENDNFLVERNIRKEKLTDKTYIYENVMYSNVEELEIFLTRLLAIRSENVKKAYKLIGLPTKYKIEDIKVLKLERSKFTDKHKLYLDAIKNSNGVIPEKTAKYMVANTDSLSIYEDTSKSSRFAIIRNFAFLDKKAVYSNFHGFSPFVNESSSPGFLLKINGKEYLLARFGFSIQRNGWVEQMENNFFMIDLEEGKGYLPMHLRGKK